MRKALTALLANALTLVAHNDDATLGESLGVDVVAVKKRSVD